MKVKFMPDNIELEISSDQSVMDLAHKNGIFIKTICNGVASCSECRIKIIDGESNVLPPGAKELALIGTGYFIDQRRLSCQLKCFGDITVDLTEQEKKKSLGVKKVLGNKKVDQDTTQAVTASIMQQETELLKNSATSDTQQRPQQRDSREGGREGRNNRDQRDNRKSNQNNNRDNRNQNNQRNQPNRQDGQQLHRDSRNAQRASFNANHNPGHNQQNKHKKDTK
jgi:ferredoxin